MKKSLSLGDISQQQPGSTRVTYTPAEAGIPERIDEIGKLHAVLSPPSKLSNNAGLRDMDGLSLMVVTPVVRGGEAPVYRLSYYSL